MTRLDIVKSLIYHNYRPSAESEKKSKDFIRKCKSVNITLKEQHTDVKEIMLDGERKGELQIYTDEFIIYIDREYKAYSGFKFHDDKRTEEFIRIFVADKLF